MNKAQTLQPTVRNLFAWEIVEARRVFGDGLDYDRLRLHEFVAWPNTINRLGHKIRGMPPPTRDNALTLGNHCFFPIELLRQPVTPDHPEFYKMTWLIHELTHCWQYQVMGWNYLLRAVWSHQRQKDSVYDFGGPETLDQMRQQGWQIYDFNLEQQGEITRTYYERLVRQQDTSAWLPYIEDVQNVNMTR